MKKITLVGVFCCMSPLAAGSIPTPKLQLTPAPGTQPTAPIVVQKVVQEKTESVRKKAGTDHKHTGIRKEIMELGSQYWGLLRTDPYMNEPMGETVSLEQELALLKKSLRYVKKEKATLDQKFETLKNSVASKKNERTQQMIALLEPSRTMCDRVIREYSRHIKVIESLRKSTAGVVVTPERSATPAVKTTK